MKRLRDYFISSTGAASLSLAVAVAPNDAAVAKFDARCNLVWAREFGPAVEGAIGASASAAATDAQGNLTVLGTFIDSVDFGAGTVTAATNSTDGVLLRLDPSGATVFATPFVNARANTSVGVAGVAVTPAGVSTLSVAASTDTDFGSGQEVSLLGPQAEDEIVQFDGAGKVLFRKPVPSINSSIVGLGQLATNASGFLWALGGGPAPIFNPLHQGARSSSWV
jgi:hypothetical protein